MFEKLQSFLANFAEGIINKFSATWFGWTDSNLPLIIGNEPEFLRQFLDWLNPAMQLLITPTVARYGWITLFMMFIAYSVKMALLQRKLKKLTTN